MADQTRRPQQARQPGKTAKPRQQQQQVEVPISNQQAAEQLAQGIFEGQDMQSLASTVAVEGSPALEPGNVAEPKQFDENGLGRYLTRGQQHDVGTPNETPLVLPTPESDKK